MGAKDRAKELISKFLLPITQRYVDQGQKVGKREINAAKECAKILVNEMMIENNGNEQYEYWVAVEDKIDNF